MGKLKRMLKTIHEENKAILSILLSMDENEDTDFEKILDSVDKMYDKDFYGE